MVSRLARRLEKDNHESDVQRIINQHERAVEDEEYIGLLSEVEEEDDSGKRNQSSN